MKKNLVVICAGPTAIHSTWNDGVSKNFDIIEINYANNSPAQFSDMSFSHLYGTKWFHVNWLIRNQYALLEKYSNIWLPDDDISTTTSKVNAMFLMFENLAKTRGVRYAQPALTHNSDVSHPVVFQNPEKDYRETNFVEIMCPLMRFDFLIECTHEMVMTWTGWGLDILWSRNARRNNAPVVIIDSTPVEHTRPLQHKSKNGIYEKINPFSELDVFLDLKKLDFEEPAEISKCATTQPKLEDISANTDADLPYAGPLVSVVIPVFNTEAFLPMCLNSILRQTYKNLDIIIVDDASPGDCNSIACEYQRLDRRINYIKHEKNLGLYQARTTGSSIAKGEYIFPVDSDDWIPGTAIEILLSRALETNADLVRGPYVIVNGAGEEILKANGLDDGIKVGQAVFDWLCDFNLTPTMWAGLYRKEIWDKATKAISINRNINIIEDVLRSVAIYHYSNISSCVTRAPVYFYRNNQASLSANAWNRQSDRSIEWQEKVADQLSDIFYVHYKALLFCLEMELLNTSHRLLFFQRRISHDVWFYCGGRSFQCFHDLIQTQRLTLLNPTPIKSINSILRLPLRLAKSITRRIYGRQFFNK